MLEEKVVVVDENETAPEDVETPDNTPVDNAEEKPEGFPEDGRPPMPPHGRPPHPGPE